MKRWQKIALGLIGIGVSGMVIKTFIEEDNKRHYSSMKVNGNDISEDTSGEFKDWNSDQENKETDESFKEKANKGLTKAAAEVVIFVNNHKAAFEAAAVVGGLIPIALNTITAIKDLREHNDILKEIKDLKERVYNTGYNAGWSDSTDDTILKLNEAVELSEPFRILSSNNDDRIFGAWTVIPYKEAA